ncbi:hypothetical protein CesoFtcFv8_020268 [Champsocephalus esox]|uniref:Uncharacterized protein n=1 Tax=Champsocephalus esox TaxID=159716 RepID=A0AAN8GNH4_9TELE|nr:hypothetical protein CesoFtcFv8_020268 [Champsocephalus esox]
MAGKLKNCRIQHFMLRWVFPLRILLSQLQSRSWGRTVQALRLIPPRTSGKGNRVKEMSSNASRTRRSKYRCRPKTG